MVNLPRLSNFQLENRVALMAMMDELMTEVEAAISDVGDMLEDNVLAPGEKPIWITFHAVLTGEQAGIDTQATALGITTEKTNYDNAVSALTTHLATLTTPVAWNALSGSTTIDGPTFRSKFNDVLTTKQTLMNKMADITGVIINPFPDVTIYADSNGTVKTGELPKDLGLTASKGATTVTTAGTWGRTATAGVTCTIGAATGILNITALSAAEATVPVSFTHSGVTRTAKVKIIRVDDPPTNSGGGGATGGTSASTTTVGNTTGTAYDLTNAISSTMTISTGTVGQIDVTGRVDFKRTDTTSGATGCLAKAQYRVPAGAWADVAAEDADDADATYTAASGGDPALSVPGSIPITQTITGLAASTTYEVRWAWLRADVSGTASNIYRSSGTITATGS